MAMSRLDFTGAAAAEMDPREYVLTFWVSQSWWCLQHVQVRWQAAALLAGLIGPRLLVAKAAYARILCLVLRRNSAEKAWIALVVRLEPRRACQSSRSA